MRRRQIFLCMLCSISVLAGCGSGGERIRMETVKNSTEEDISSIEEPAAGMYSEEEWTEGEEANQDEQESNDEDGSVIDSETSEQDIYYSKDELTDGIYLIKGDTFERIKSDNLNVIGNAFTWVEYEEGEWLCLHPGDQLAFKGNYDPTQNVNLECSVHDFYTFPYKVSTSIDGKYLNVRSVFGDQPELGVDTITVDGQATSFGGTYSKSDSNLHFSAYLEGLDWRIGEDHGMGRYLDGNFTKGFQATMSGFQGTEYKEIDMAATCHVMEMPDGTLPEENYRRNVNFETTRDGYFLLTIPTDMPAGYGEITSYPSYAMDATNIQLYVKIE